MPSGLKEKGLVGCPLKVCARFAASCLACRIGELC
jgi:hypothetical protein